MTSDVPASALQVGGLVAFSATDFPGRLSAVVFVQGCPWRCHYCHNPHLQTRCEAGALDWQNLRSWLARRVGLLDAVVFSGGEPCMDPALPQAMCDVRAMGFAVGLHTAGIYPRRLGEVLPWVDWVGLDIKAAPERYASITQVSGSGAPAWECANAVLASGVEHEFRTTIHPDLHSEDDVRDLGLRLQGMGVRHYAVQEFRPTGCNDMALATPVGHAGPLISAALQTELAACFDTFTYRSASTH